MPYLMAFVTFPNAPALERFIRKVIHPFIFYPFIYSFLVFFFNIKMGEEE